MAFTTTEFVADNLESITDVNADGTEWACVYDVKNPKCEFVELLYKYTKNTSTNFTLKTEFVSKRVSGEFFGETILDTTSMTVDDATLTIDTAGSYSIRIPVGIANDKVKITITPDVAGGTDTLEIYIDELTSKSSR